MKHGLKQDKHFVMSQSEENNLRGKTDKSEHSALKLIEIPELKSVFNLPKYAVMKMR